MFCRPNLRYFRQNSVAALMLCLLALLLLLPPSALQVIENKPSRVVVLLPASVKAGEFTVEVRTKLDSSGKPLKMLKKGGYKKSVTAITG